MVEYYFQKTGNSFSKCDQICSFLFLCSVLYSKDPPFSDTGTFKTQSDMSDIVFFAEIVNGLKLLNIFAKRSMLDI